MTLTRESNSKMSKRALAFSVEALLGRTDPTAKRQKLDKSPEEGPPACASTPLLQQTQNTGSEGKEPEDRCQSPESPVYTDVDVCSSLSTCGTNNGERCPTPDTTSVSSTTCQRAIASPEEKEGIKVELCSPDLWQKFHHLGTEMIITKAGRRMFPTIKVRVHGLDPEASYIVFQDIIPLDNKRYRYVYHSSQWMVAGSGDPPLPYNTFIHSDSPATGQLWMTQGVISFDKLKLTNNRKPIIKGQVSLHSMHKYLPRIHIQKTSDLETSVEQQIDISKALTFSFQETAFTTVTAYQNQQITRLKIASNPFAKGFREASRSRENLDENSMQGSRFGCHLVPRGPLFGETFLQSDIGSSVQTIVVPSHVSHMNPIPPTLPTGMETRSLPGSSTSLYCNVFEPHNMTFPSTQPNIATNLSTSIGTLFLPPVGENTDFMGKSVLVNGNTLSEECRRHINSSMLHTQCITPYFPVSSSYHMPMYNIPHLYVEKPHTVATSLGHVEKTEGRPVGEVLMQTPNTLSSQNCFCDARGRMGKIQERCNEFQGRRSETEVLDLSKSIPGKLHL